MVQQTLKSVRPAANAEVEANVARERAAMPRKRTSLRMRLTSKGRLATAGSSANIAFSPGLLSRRVTSPEVDGSRTSTCVKQAGTLAVHFQIVLNRMMRRLLALVVE